MRRKTRKRKSKQRKTISTETIVAKNCETDSQSRAQKETRWKAKKSARIISDLRNQKIICTKIFYTTLKNKDWKTSSKNKASFFLAKNFQSGFIWFMAVRAGSWRFKLVHGGSNRSMPIQGGPWRFKAVNFGSSQRFTRFTLVYCGPSWSMAV